MEHIISPTGTLFIDIDGTIIDHTTGKPAAMAVEKINKAYDKGYMIIITTLRGDRYWPDIEDPLGEVETIKLLSEIGLKYHQILWNIPSPRILINDDGAKAIEHPSNSSWKNYQF